jgi:hypothetical protein
MKKLVFALLLAATPVLAQTPGEPETVYSDAQWYKDYSRSAQTLDALAAPVSGVDGQYARWKDPVCFNVYGLAPAIAYAMKRRMKEVAHHVGAPLDASESCTPNVTIIFTSDPDATRQSIWEVRPWLVPGLGMIRNRVRQEQPIQAWYAGLLRGPNGRRILWDGYDEDFYYSTGFGAGFVENPMMSRLNSGIETEIGAVTIIVDSKAILGMTLGALADHFALLSLAEAHVSRQCKPVETIANLMRKDCGPAATALTQNDLVMLTGLYKTPDDFMQTMQRARILGNMRKAFEADFRAGGR